ncbi:MAG: DNA primase catalytic subunit PriS [Thermoplasmata archaeon]
MGNSIDYVMKKFREYYINSKISLPVRFTQREFGFMFFNTEGMIRHLKFHDEKELREFIVKNIPSHSYYSTAYYRYPDKERMDEKGWMGADLIFDLDADHITEGRNLTYEEMLEEVKRETKKLIYDFLISDFGINKNDIRLVFSGGRGYHIHIRNEKVVKLNSDARREIVSYITGNNMRFDFFVEESIKNEKLFDEDYGGWYKKFTDQTKHVAIIIRDYLDSNDFETVENIMKNSGIKYRKRLINALLQEKPIKLNGKNNSRVIDLLSELNNTKWINLIGNNELIYDFLNLVKYFVSVNVVGKTDEPVTKDIHRLIRLPGTLHGKTGLKVTEVELEKLDDFDPLNDSVIKEFMKKDIKVIIKKKFSINFSGQKYNFNEGEDVMPESLAIFAILRNFAEIM